MANNEIKIDFQWQRGTAIRWQEQDPILKAGEPGLESDTGQFKIGDGGTTWNQLPYFYNSDGIVSIISDFISDIQGDFYDPRVGDLSLLTTSVRSDLVTAINALNTPSVPFTLLYANAKAG